MFVCSIEEERKEFLKLAGYKPKDVETRWENVTFNDTAASPPDKSPRILKEIFHIWEDSRMDSYPPTEDDFKRVCLC